MRKFLSYTIVSVAILLTIALFAVNHANILAFYAVGALNNIIVVALSFIVYFLLIRRIAGFYENFFHELTHMLFSIAFIENVKQFFASQTHGELVTGSSFRNILTQTSPYFFPLITILLIAVWPDQLTGPFRLIVPASYGVFLAIMARQIIHNSQEILSFNWYGVLFVLVMNFWISMYVFSWYSGRTNEFTNILKIQNHEHRKISNNNSTFSLSDFLR